MQSEDVIEIRRLEKSSQSLINQKQTLVTQCKQFFLFLFKFQNFYLPLWLRVQSPNQSHLFPTH